MPISTLFGGSGPQVAVLSFGIANGVLSEVGGKKCLCFFRAKKGVVESTNSHFQVPAFSVACCILHLLVSMKTAISIGTN